MSWEGEQGRATHLAQLCIFSRQDSFEERRNAETDEVERRLGLAAQDLEAVEEAVVEEGVESAVREKGPGSAAGSLRRYCRCCWSHGELHPVPRRSPSLPPTGCGCALLAPRRSSPRRLVQQVQSASMPCVGGKSEGRGTDLPSGGTSARAGRRGGGRARGRTHPRVASSIWVRTVSLLVMVSSWSRP